MAAPPETIWAMLLDPQALMAIVPGAHGVEKLSETHFRAEVTLGVGPVKGRYRAEIRLSDLDPPHAVTLSGGTDGALGFGRGTGRVTLAAEGADRTVVTYRYEAEIGGRVASIGGRLLDGAARVVIGQFFAALAQQAGGERPQRRARLAATPARAPRMKPAAFDYLRADSLGEALEALHQQGPEARILAGGQSLLPMLNMRLARPAVLVDVMHVAGLRQMQDADGMLVVGAAVRQRQVEHRPDLTRTQPLLAAALPWVGHTQTRNAGTLCGSVAHADPSAEVPLVLLALDGEGAAAVAPARPPRSGLGVLHRHDGHRPGR